MAEKTLLTRIALHRDNEANYSASTVYMKGEVCLVDTASGLKVKIGDGTTQFGSIEYLDKPIYDEIDRKILQGYYMNSTFYTDSTYQIELPKYLDSIYIDRNGGANQIYNYDGTQYVSVNDTLPTASETQAGIMKLYQTHGSNEDGAMSQKIVTDGVNSIKFAVDDNESECLILDLPWD